MAFVSGVANNFGALKDALVAACTDRGWTLSGNVLHKGVAFVELLTTGVAFTIRGGTDIDGGNALTGAAPDLARMGLIGTNNVAFPATYSIHVLNDPDEVYLLVNYNVDFWQWMAFGTSDVPGLPGTGGWYGAFLGSNPVSALYMTPSAAGSLFNSYGAGGLFFDNDNTAGAGRSNSSVHHGFEGGGWSLRGTAVNCAQALSAIVPKYGRQPNAWNAASSLINYQVYVRRIDNKQSLAADFAHARLIRLDNLQPGDVVTLGADRWRVYPWHRRDTTNRDGATNIQHSGTMGWAIRYDGP